jgi:hypothetical protein
MKLDISVYQRRWQALDKNREHMRDLILKLMENPATEPEHLAQAHAMYADTCKALHGVSFIMENYLRTGVKPSQEMIGAHFPKIAKVECACGEIYSAFADGKWSRCPACGML